MLTIPPGHADDRLLVAVSKLQPYDSSIQALSLVMGYSRTYVWQLVQKAVYFGRVKVVVSGRYRKVLILDQEELLLSQKAISRNSQ